MEDPFISRGEKIVLETFRSDTALFSDCSTTSSRLLRAQLMVLTSLGGVLLPPHTLVLQPLQPLLKQEARLYWPEGLPWDQVILMVHKMARVTNQAWQLDHQVARTGRHPVEAALDGWPGLVRREQPGEGRVAVVEEGLDLLQLYSFHIILVNNTKLDNLDFELDVLLSEDSLHHLLRMIWLRL